MNIHEAAKRSGASLTILRKLEKLKLIAFDDENEMAHALRFHLARNQQLTTVQILTLIEQPDLLGELGTYQTRARLQLAVIGDVKATQAPGNVTAEIREAGKGDDDAALVLARWLMATLPVEPVSHQWVAARLLFPLSEFMRAQTAPMVSLAMLNVRRLPEFAGNWKREKIDGKPQSRYFRVDL